MFDDFELDENHYPLESALNMIYISKDCHS